MPGVDDWAAATKFAHLRSCGGYVAPGYESVRDLFLQSFEPDGQENSAQVCAYVRGVKVVDLWASRVHDWYGPESLQNIFSSSKVLTSIVVAMLVDRGFLRYTDRVADHWPEFAQHGKEGTTVAMLMRHEAGLAKLNTKLNVEDLTTEAIKAGAVSSTLAAQKPLHAPGKRRVYHAVSRGWFVNELVRRCDPKGRTIGEFLREEVALPLGYEDELCIGLADRLNSRVAPLKAKDVTWTFRQALLPRFLGGGKLVGAPWKLRLAFVVGLPFYTAGTRALRLVSGLLSPKKSSTPSKHRESTSGGGDAAGHSSSDKKLSNSGGINELLSGEWAMDIRVPRRRVVIRSALAAGVASSAASANGSSTSRNDDAGDADNEDDEDDDDDASRDVAARFAARELFQKLDRNGDGRVNRDELVAALAGGAGGLELEAGERENLKQFFELLDSNHDGLIEADELEEYSTRRFTLRATFNRRCVRRAELPSANGHCSARAMAAVACAMVNDGAAPIRSANSTVLGVDGSHYQLLSPGGVKAAVSNPVTKKMFRVQMPFTNAGVCQWGAMRKGYVGWLGIGGSVMQWHPEEEISFAYAMDTMELVPWNARGLLLQTEVLKCAQREHGSSKSRL